MTTDQLIQSILGEFNDEPTAQQRALIDALARFCEPSADSTSVFLLNGYAGTGKTSVVAALVKALARQRRQVVLLAPTGRAAKVLGNMADRKAMTIHRKIYKGDAGSGHWSVIGDNPHRQAIFVVDEASMIGDSVNDGESLLSDLIHYVYGSGDDCRMILLGDTAQLPPVGCDRSPAMSPARLRAMGLKVSRAVITQTVRQSNESGILHNATMLRREMAQGAADRSDLLSPPRLRVTGHPDVSVSQTEDLEDDIASLYSLYGIDNNILITRSNRRALLYNQAIRSQILDKDEILTRDEPVLVAKNNYYWTSKVRGADFIANGDIARIDRLYGFETIGSLQFADASVTLPDRDITIDVKLLLNSLNSDTAGITPDDEQQLIDMVMRNADPAAVATRVGLERVLRTDPYFNALRVKYAYAVTCHKAQGGQWQSVLVDMAGIGAEAATTYEFYRWLYTATTRATERLTYIAPTVDVD